MNNLRRLRESKSMSQIAVAHAVGVTPQAVGKWERDEGYPKWTMAPKLAKLFCCTIDELYAEHSA